VEGHRLQHLCVKVAEEEETLLMIDTSGCGMGEEGGENESKMNVGEADLVLSVYKKLIGYEVKPSLIAVITPYSKQVAYIKTLITEAGVPLPDISTVDGIQGREKECIIISLVRSNSKQGIGFLKDWRRMNVAVTRARRMLVLIGNAECASADKHM
jgi:superfamily I DNA and/or RNA helicase